MLLQQIKSNAQTLEEEFGIAFTMQYTNSTERCCFLWLLILGSIMHICPTIENEFIIAYIMSVLQLEFPLLCIFELCFFILLDGILVCCFSF